MHSIIETHCHLDYLKDEDLEVILEKSKEQMIEKIITISVDPDNLDEALKLATSYDHIYCTQGIHPHDAKEMTEEVLKKIKSQASSHKKVVAIGEIGLDYHYDNSPRDIQRAVFKDQIIVAQDLNLPVVIHSRDADDDMIDILKSHAQGLDKKGVIHSFTSGLDLAHFALDNGFYLGFNGIITFKKAEEVREALRITPLDRLLLETDSPFLTPVPHRGKENAPYFLPYIAAKVAEIKNESIENVCKQANINANLLFQF